MRFDHAISVALAFVKETFGGAGHRLEELSANDEDGSFDITVSFRDGEAGTVANRSGFVTQVDDDGVRRLLVGIDTSRTYKVITVAADGIVRDARVRSFAF